MPELDVRWRRLSVNAKGKDAIDAIRKPLFLLLLLNTVLTATVVVAAMLRENWPAITNVFAWLP